MYGTYGYNKIIRKTVALFGDMFNEIYTARIDQNGDLRDQKRVPIAYAPKESFLARLAENPDLTDDRLALKLPRISFEISGSLVYDSERQVSKNVSCTVINANGDPIQIFAPSPYTIPFQLNVYSNNQDEALQIVEQILPYFKPSIKRTYRPIDGQTFTDEVKFTLLNTSLEDSYANDYLDQRQIIYTLDFEASINIYGRVDTSAGTVILNSIVNFTDSSGDVDEQTITQSVNPPDAQPGDPYTVDINYTYGFE